MPPRSKHWQRRRVEKKRANIQAEEVQDESVGKVTTRLRRTSAGARMDLYKAPAHVGSPASTEARTNVASPCLLIVVPLMCGRAVAATDRNAMKQIVAQFRTAPSQTEKEST